MKNKVESKIPANTISIDNNIENCEMSGYKIIRTVNGEAFWIELTTQELNEAFARKEQQYYLTDVKLVLEEMEQEDKLYGRTAAEITDNQELMDAILSDYTRNRNKYDMEANAAAVEAISSQICESGKKG